MITLHGFAASNYYNLVKHVLLYKELPFEENLVFSGGEEWLAVSPVGKIPAITTADGRHLSESSVICDFLEETYPQKPLYPTDVGERAAVRQIMKIAELYLELPSRRLIPYALAGKTAPEPVIAEIRQVLNRGVGAMQRLCQFSPWVVGDQLTMADIYLFYVNTIVTTFGSSQLEMDIQAEIPGMSEWNTLMSESSISQIVEQGRVANQADFMAYVKEQQAAARGKK